MNGTSSLTSAGVTSFTSSIPHDFADAIRRRSSSSRSSVRATSMPALVQGARVAVLLHRVERELRHLLRVVDREDEVRRVTGRAAGVRERALLDLDEIAP